MKRLLTVVAFFVMATTAFAQHRLNYMMMNVVLDTNGDAYVQELRQMDIGSQGTECYISFNNLPEGMELQGLTVSEDTIVYTVDKTWNINRSRSRKAYHCGFHPTEAGVEICWGIGDMGSHTYMVRYVIKNLVRSYKESDGFNHSFYEAANPPANTAFVVIHALQRNDSIAHTPEDIWNLPYFQVTSLDDWVNRNLAYEGELFANQVDDENDVTKQEGMTPWGKPIANAVRTPLFSLMELRQIADSLNITIDSLVTVLSEHPRLVANFLNQNKVNHNEQKLDTLSHPRVKAWAFGYNGYVDFYPDGSLRAMNDSLPMNEGESIIIMAEFEKGMFNPAMKGSVDKFETIKVRAFYDSDYTLDDEEDGTDKVSASLMGGDSQTSMLENIIVEGIVILIFVLLIGLPLWGIIYFIRRLIWGKQIDQKKWDKNMSKLLGEDVRLLPYYRDPPAGGKLTFSQRILTGLRPEVELGISQLIEAFMLRLLYKGSIQITTETTENDKVRDVFQISQPDVISIDEEYKDHQQIIGLYSDPMRDAIRLKEAKVGVKIDDEHLENLLHRLLYAAAGEDHLLQPDELKDYIEANPLKIRPYASAVNYVVNASVRTGNIPKEEAKQVYCFHKFLKDFTLVNEREMTEVSLWKEYMVFASLYGMADQVRKAMKKIAPDIAKLDDITSMLLASGSSAVLVGSLITTMNRSYRFVETFRTAQEIQAARAARSLSGSSYSGGRRSSGGGGRSSYRGGGGHSGGGGSGVR